LASLSILELIEYGFTRRDINRAMVKGVIALDKPAVLLGSTSKGDVVQRVLETGDYYFGVLNSKVRLTRFGLLKLEIIVADQMQAAGKLPEPGKDAASQISAQSFPLKEINRAVDLKQGQIAGKAAVIT
jgi:hypothetical protein